MSAIMSARSNIWILIQKPSTSSRLHHEVADSHTIAPVPGTGTRPQQ